MDPADYERLVKSLLTTVFDRMHAEVFHLKKYVGKSGQAYEIDVSFETRIDTLELLIFVECKRYERLVTIKEVADFVYRLRDVGAHKGILVSTKGFQRGAIQVAKAEKIALLIVRDAIAPKRTGIKTVLSLSRHDNLPWFRGLILQLSSDGEDILIVKRWNIPQNANHHIVEFGSARATLQESQIGDTAQGCDVRPCFRLINAEPAIE